MALTNRDPLRSRLHEVEDEIRGRVRLVCTTPPPEDLDTGAMIRFEEALSIVTSAAKEAVSLRRRLRVEQVSEGIESRASERSRAPDAGPDGRAERSG
jgi:hypothetical protein